eukprot:8018551-Karenia_brevis.AAC.1
MAQLLALKSWVSKHHFRSSLIRLVHQHPLKLPCVCSKCHVLPDPSCLQPFALGPPKANYGCVLAAALLATARVSS